MKVLLTDSGVARLLGSPSLHLVWLERWAPGLGALAAYGFLLGFPAPIVRGLARRGWGGPARRRFGWTRLQFEAVFVVVALLLEPTWLLSRSFVMSWVCGLALALPSWPNARWERAFRLYIVLWPFAGGSPIWIFWNVLLLPLVATLLFPACALTAFLPHLASGTDALWRALNWLLEHGPVNDARTWRPATTWLWAVPFSLHVFLLIAEVRWRRAWAFSSSLA